MPKLRSLSASSCQRSRRQFLGPRECFAAECWVLERKSSTAPESGDQEKKTLSAKSGERSICDWIVYCFDGAMNALLACENSTSGSSVLICTLTNFPFAPPSPANV